MLELVGEHEHAISLIKTLKGYTFLDYDLDEYEGSGLTTLTFKKEVKMSVYKKINRETGRKHYAISCMTGI